MAAGDPLSQATVKALAVSQWGASTERIPQPNIGPGISSRFLLADIMTEIAWLESNFVPTIENPTHHKGLWQISPLHTNGLRAAGIISTEADLFKPDVNVKAAKWVYDQQGLDAWSTKDQALSNLASGTTAIPSGTAAPRQTDPGLLGGLPNPLGWTDALGKFFGIITNPTFWKRIGLGALGIGVLIAAFIFYNKDEIQETAEAIK